MSVAKLEHANVTVSDPDATAAWMGEVFGWRIRWQGDAINGGRTLHVGEDDTYIAIYNPRSPVDGGPVSYNTVGGLNHLAVTVEDLDATEEKVKAVGFMTKNHADYEPGRRFYFHDNDGIEYEVVSYA